MLRFTRRHIGACLALLALSACATAAAPPPDAELYYGFTLLDPATQTRRENAYMVVADGRIAAIGTGAPPRVAAERRHDMRGAYALPGLIDTHAHVTLSRIDVTLEDGAPVLAALSEPEIVEHTARTLVSFGVTTVRNPGGATGANADYARRVATGELVGPEALQAGELLDTMRFDGLSTVVTDAASIEAAVAAQADAGMRYIKLYHGLNEEQFAAGVAAAHRHGLRAITHTGHVSWVRAAALGVDGFVHAMPISADLLPADRRDGYQDAHAVGAHAFYDWWERADLDSPEMQALIAELARRQITVDLTLIVFQKTFFGDEARIRDANLEYAHPLMRAFWQRFRFDAGWAPEHYARAHAVWPKLLRFARMLHEAGVPLTLGTDLANPFVAPGADLIAEMRLHQDAGIPAWAVLHMATTGAAQTMGIADRTGRIARGMEADVVFLDADPTVDVANAMQTRAVLLDGRMFDPAALR